MMKLHLLDYNKELQANEEEIYVKSHSILSVNVCLVSSNEMHHIQGCKKKRHPNSYVISI